MNQAANEEEEPRTPFTLTESWQFSFLERALGERLVARLKGSTDVEYDAKLLAAGIAINSPEDD